MGFEMICEALALLCLFFLFFFLFFSLFFPGVGVGGGGVWEGVFIVVIAFGEGLW